MSQGWLITHKPCPRCGSSDAASLNSDGWWTCFSCNERWPEDGQHQPDSRPTEAAGLLNTGEPVTVRGITTDTAEMYGYCYSQDGQWHVAPYRKGGRVVAQHLRGRGKEFRWAGDPKGVELWGQHLWRKPGKMVVVTEGELDCLSVAQVQGNRWPVVSLPNGAKSASKVLTEQLPWLSRYDRIVLMFDSDEPGQEAAKEAASVLPIGKAYIADLGEYKDPNQALMAEDPRAILRAMWEAEEWRPDGLVTVTDLKDRLMSPVEEGLPWFDDRLTELTHGRYPNKGQVWVLGAGTGVGKTAWLIRQLTYDLSVLNIRVGCFFLETELAEVLQRIASILNDTLYHIPSYLDDTQREALWQTISAYTEQLFLYDSFGAADVDTIKGLIRYLAKAHGVEVFYIDNLSQLTDEGRIRESVEEAAKGFKSLADELSVTILVASHLNTPEHGAHEEGARVSLRHFYGSRKLAAWVDGAFALERNTTAASDAKLISTLRVLKARMAGSSVGETCSYRYNPRTDSLDIADPSADQSADEMDFDFEFE